MTDSKDAPACAIRQQPDGASEAEAITKLLAEGRTIAVVGLSSNASRPSHGVAEYLQSAGYRIIPVNPAESEVLGQRAYATLEDVPEKIDVVDIFRRSEFVGDIVESAIKLKAKAVWMQEGVVNEAAAARAQEAGLAVVMDRCMLKEHWKRRNSKR
jgi:uncharacterized protein